MATGKILSPARAPTKHRARGVLRLRSTTDLRSPSYPHRHAKGWEFVASGGGQQEDGVSDIPLHTSPIQGRGHTWHRCQGGHAATRELSFGSWSPLQDRAVEDGHHHMVGYTGRVGYNGQWSGYPGGGVVAIAAESGSVAVHTCQVCFKSFSRPKALYGHMRSCRRAATAADQPPVVPQQEPWLTKGGSAAGLMGRTWAVTRQHGQGWIPSHGTSSQQTRSAHVVTGPLQIREKNLEQPWSAGITRGADDLMFFNAGLSPVAGSQRNPAKIPKVKIPEPLYTACNSFVVPPGATVIVIDDEDDEPKKSVEEINASSVTIAISAHATVATAPALATRAAAVTIAPAPYAATAMATIAPLAATVTIAAMPHGNGAVAAPTTAGAGEMKVFPCTKCSRVFNCFLGLGAHMDAHINMEKRAKEKVLQGNGRRTHLFPTCGKEFETGQPLGGHMRLHYGRAAPSWVAPSHSSSFMSPSLATYGSSGCVYKPEVVMATDSGISLPAASASTSSFPLEDQPTGVMATACPKGTRGSFRLFGINIYTGPKEEPEE